MTEHNIQLDPVAGEKLRALLVKEMEQVDNWLNRSQDLARRAPLGRNPVGEAMAAKFGGRADDGGRSLAGVLTPYRQILQDTHDAVTEAMKRYKSTERTAVEALRKAAAETDERRLAALKPLQLRKAAGEPS